MTIQKTPGIVTIIQTRTGSSRLPGKVLMPLARKPLFVQQVKRVLAAELCGTVVVATTMDAEDDIIEKICREEGFNCFRGHPTDLLDRHYKAALFYNASVVVKIPGDCPLIGPSIINRVIGYHMANQHRFDFVSNLHPATYPDGNDVEVMALPILKDAWENADKFFEREHTTPYIWERPEEYRIGNVVSKDGKDHSQSHRFTVDYLEDYLFIKAVFDELYSAKHLFSCNDILELLKKREDIFKVNHQYAGEYWYRNHLGELKTIAPSSFQKNEPVL